MHHQDSSGCRECSVRPDFEAFARPGGRRPPHGRELLAAGGPVAAGCHLIMESVYQGEETLRLARQLGYTPVVPPNPGRLKLWDYDRVIYRRRNEIERLFRRLKGYRRVFSRFDKLDVLFTGFIVFALIVEALRFSVNTPSSLLR